MAACRAVWLGAAGNGTRLKLVLNNWLATQVEAAAETIALAEAMGLKPELVTDTLAESPLGSPYAVAKGRAMIEGDSLRPSRCATHSRTSAWYSTPRMVTRSGCR